jgi:hypothetical protein
LRRRRASPMKANVENLRLSFFPLGGVFIDHAYDCLFLEFNLGGRWPSSTRSTTVCFLSGLEGHYLSHDAAEDITRQCTFSAVEHVLVFLLLLLLGRIMKKLQHHEHKALHEQAWKARHPGGLSRSRVGLEQDIQLHFLLLTIFYNRRNRPGFQIKPWRMAAGYSGSAIFRLQSAR